MSARLGIGAIAAAAVLFVVAYLMHAQARALDQRSAAEVDAIRARAAVERVVVAVPGPVRVVTIERERIRRVAPGADPIASATIETGTVATGAPVVECPHSSAGGPPSVRCPSPEIGCRTNITGWRHESGAVMATGTQTLRWRWPDQDWQESSADITPDNTTVTVAPEFARPTPGRWLVGGTIGIDDDAELRYSVVAARRLGTWRGWSAHALGQVMVGGGDVIVSGGLGLSR